MSRLTEHLEHISSQVVPQRGAARGGLAPAYVQEIEGRTQPPHLVRGLEQWNAGHFYEQHETLEWLWRATAEPVRDALKGIIQAGVGAYHVQRHNRRGALGKWTGAIGYLEPFDGLRPYGIDIASLRRQIAAARLALLTDEQALPDWEAHLATIATLHIAWELRPAAPRVTALLRRMDLGWHESQLGVDANIRGLTEEEATWEIVPDGRTIRFLLGHLGASKAVSAARCFGDGKPRSHELHPPDRWSELLRWLTAQHEALREPLGFLSDEQLDEPRLVEGQLLSVERLLQETIEHDIYHAGQVKLLRDLYRRGQRER